MTVMALAFALLYFTKFSDLYSHLSTDTGNLFNIKSQDPQGKKLMRPHMKNTHRIDTRAHACAHTDTHTRSFLDGERVTWT